MRTNRGIAIVALAVACGKDEGSSGSSGTEGGEVPAACVAAGWDTSRAAYEGLAAQADGTYWYSIITHEQNSDFSWLCRYRTTIEVVGGELARRELEIVEIQEGTLPEECSGVPFIEEGDEVGAMAVDVAFPAYTMEELYSRCCDLLSLEPAEMYSPVFEVDEDGVVELCVTLENGCGEGCEAAVDDFRGFRFAEFEFGPGP